MRLYDKLPATTRDAIIYETAAFSTALEGLDRSAEKLWKKAEQIRRQTAAQEGLEETVEERHQQA